MVNHSFENGNTYFRVESRLRRVVSALPGFKVHSKICRTFHPSFFSNSMFLVSFALVLFIFSSHHLVLVFGTTKYLQFSCPCQKHPFTKITVLYFGKTMSGFPGSFLQCSRYLKPFACRNFLTSISGFVSAPLILLML